MDDLAVKDQVVVRLFGVSYKSTGVTSVSNGSG